MQARGRRRASTSCSGIEGGASAAGLLGPEMMTICRCIRRGPMALPVSIGCCGDDPAVRLPQDVARRAGFATGMSVEIDARPGEIVIRSVGPRYSLNELLEGVTHEAMRDAFDWGGDV